jgi:hypothetical protein
VRRSIGLPLLLVLLCGPAAADAAPRAPCDAAAGRLVVVDTAAHTLWLCSDRRVVGRFEVALGRGGLDKRREGDGRTPLGAYALGSPRPSARFGTFVPIGYPTAGQRARGFTGRNVGIHGPDRRATWLKRLSTWIDWTAGCVATGTDEEMRAIAAFVRERRPRVLLE